MVKATLRPLTRAEGKLLRTKLRKRSLSAQVHQRYRVIAEVRAGCSARAAAERVGVTRNTAATWIRRFNESGFRTFERVPNPIGRIPIIRGEQIRRLVITALSDPEELGLPFATWTVKRLSEYCKEHDLIPEFTDEWVRRLLRREGLTPQRIRTWKHSEDPRFGPKAAASAPSTSSARRARRSSASTSSARSSSGPLRG